MKFLYLDDSGKIPSADPSKVAVFSGFSIDKQRWKSVSRQIAGAKSKMMPKRGDGNPHKWEIKSHDFLTVKAWNRAKNRRFCLELINILKRNGCRIFSVSLEKSKAKNTLEEERYLPMMIQTAAWAFHDQLSTEGKHGTIVCDWSTYRMDQHVANCVESLAASRSMDYLIGGVSFCSSEANLMLQVADIIASAVRRWAESQPHVKEIFEAIKSIEYTNNLSRDDFGYLQPKKGILKVF